MEAAPRLPMISFELKTCTEVVSFSTKLKQYIATFYHEDPESYNNEIQNLQKLRGSAVLPSKDVAGVQTLKKYYCQLKFLRSRFPMDKGAICAPQVSWKDPYAGVVCSATDIDLELMSVLYNVGALHSQLGAMDTRQTPEGMKMACTHFQCAAWAFKEAREIYPQAVAASLAHEVLHFMEIVCLAQAQECILEKSMSDSRKCTIIAKVAAQAVSYYDQAGQVLSCQPEGAASEVTDIIGSRVVKDWCRYIKFKSAYHNCISLLYQGQHCEEQQKMGERCALYQASADKLEEARKLANGKLSALTNSTSSQAEIEEALAFTLDVVEGKRKAARNENEFIYHETVPEKDTIPPLQGASLVRPIPFGINDPDVSGPDIFARLVPMEAHEASSVYSEKKAELLRRTGAVVEERDRELEEFMGSLHQIDILLERLGQPQTIPQDIVDRAAALNARPQAVQALVDAMSKLSSVHFDVDSLLNEAQVLIDREKEASSAADRRQVVSMPINDLSRECAKYREALNKASESNEALHRAMSAHVANLKVLAQPLAAVDKHLPKITLSDEDRPALDELRKLIDKVEEMRQQRTQLIAQLREAARSDDITSRLAVNRDRSSAEMENLFDTELAKHRPQVALIEQNLSAQQNILHALTDSYAKLSTCRKQIVEAFRKRDQIITALIASYDAYEDLLAKVNKGIDFYQKLESNVNKLLQRLRSTCRVQEEEREQKNASITPQNQTPAQTPVVPATPKLRDYLQQPVGVRPAPLGSEHTDLTKTIDLRNPLYAGQFPNLPNGAQNYQLPSHVQHPRPSNPQNYAVNHGYPQTNNSNYQQVPISATITSQSYPTSTMQNNPSPNLDTVSKPQNIHNPQVTPSMPQYQVAPTQYPTNATQNPQMYPNYPGVTPGTQYLTSHANKVSQSYPPVPQSPTLPQGYPNSPQNYPNYPGYQNPQGTVSPQKSVTPTHISGQYQNGQSYQVPNSPGPTQNQTRAPQNNAIPNVGANMYPGSQVGHYSTSQYNTSQAGSYPSPKGGGYSQMVPGQGVGGSVTQNQYSNVVQGPNGANVGQYPNSMGIGTSSIQYPTSVGQTVTTMAQYGPVGQTAQYQNSIGQVRTSTGQGQGQYTPAMAQTGASTGQYQNTVGHTLGQYQPPVGQTGGTTLGQMGTTGQYQGQIGTTRPYPQPYQPPMGQFSGNTSYPITTTPNVPVTSANWYPSQPATGYPPNSAVPGSPQQNLTKPSSTVASPQRFGSPQPGVSTQGNQIRPANPYYQGTQYPGYQSGSQMGSYPQGSKNVYPQYQNSVPYQGQQYQNNPGVYYQAPVPQSTPVPNQNQVQNLPNPSLNAAKKNSNIDLLAGLDFNVNQAPLDPVKAPLHGTNVDPNVEKSPSEVEIHSTDKQPLEDHNNDTKINHDPDRWKKEQSFEKDVNNLDYWVTSLMEQELESKWKILQKENEKSHVVISVARCYPGRNRCPDSLPYDRNRFELPVPPASDDYINASKVQVTNLPPLIITQAPLATTIQQFWTMVANSGAELVICLMTDAELQGAGLGEGYWRMDYGAHLRSTQVGQYWTERILAVAGKDISHLQLTTSWPSIGSGDIINGLSDLAIEVIRRRKNLPIVIHCLTGIGRSGVFSVLLEVASELLPSNGPPILIDPLEAAVKLSEFRKNPIRDRLHLEFTYRAVLKMARFILPAPVVQDNIIEKVEQHVYEIKDPLSDLDPLWKLKIDDN